MLLNYVQKKDTLESTIKANSRAGDIVIDLAYELGNERKYLFLYSKQIPSSF